MLMQDVIRLVDRYLDNHNTEAIDRQERLFSCIALVAVFHFVLSIAFAKLQEIEKRHHVYHPESCITYDLMIAPPVVHRKVEIPVTPPPTSLVQGRTDVGGKRAAAAHSEKLEIPLAPTPQQALQQVGDPVALNPTTATPLAAQPAGSLVQNGNGSDGQDKIGDNGEGAGAGGTIGGGTTIDNAGGEPVASTQPIPQPEKRDIAPYRKAMLIALAEVWRPKRDDALVIMLTLAKDGSILKAEVEQASSEGALNRITKALQKVQFEPLPDWYRKDALRIRLHLNGPDQ